MPATEATLGPMRTCMWAKLAKQLEDKEAVWQRKNKALEAKLKLQKKMVKPGGRASGLAALRAQLGW